jgi:hypothetical protein
MALGPEMTRGGLQRDMRALFPAPVHQTHDRQGARSELAADPARTRRRGDQGHWRLPVMAPSRRYLGAEGLPLSGVKRPFRWISR